MKHEVVDGGVTLALGGIGIRGALNIGLLQAITAAKIPIKQVVATGISAMIGAYYALGRDPGEVLPRIIQFFKENHRLMWQVEQLGGLTAGEKRMAARSMSYFLRENLFCSANLTRMGVFSWDLVETSLSQVFGDYTTRDLETPFAVSVIDIEAGEETLLSEGSVVDLVRAGIAFPGLFPPVEIKEHRYVSSATYCELPLFSLSDADRPIIALSCSEHREVRRPRSIIEVLARVDEIRGNALTQQTIFKADRVIELEKLGVGNWSSFRKLEKTMPLVQQLCARQISSWDSGLFAVSSG